MIFLVIRSKVIGHRGQFLKLRVLRAEAYYIGDAVAFVLLTGFTFKINILLILFKYYIKIIYKFESFLHLHSLVNIVLANSIIRIKIHFLDQMKSLILTMVVSLREIHYRKILI